MIKKIIVCSSIPNSDVIKEDKNNVRMETNENMNKYAIENGSFVRLQEDLVILGAGLAQLESISCISNKIIAIVYYYSDRINPLLEHMMDEYIAARNNNFIIYHIGWLDSAERLVKNHPLAGITEIIDRSNIKELVKLDEENYKEEEKPCVKTTSLNLA